MCSIIITSGPDSVYQPVGRNSRENRSSVAMSSGWWSTNTGVAPMPRIVSCTPGPRNVSRQCMKWSPGRVPSSQNSRTSMLGPRPAYGAGVGSPVVPEVEKIAENTPRMVGSAGSMQSSPP